MQSHGLVLFATNADIERREIETINAKREAEEKQSDYVETSLAAHIKRRWELAKRHKEPFERRMLDSLRQIEGRYSDAKAQEIKEQGLPLIYMSITSVKCRAAKSWIRDVLMPAGDKPWSLKATTVPSLSNEVTASINQRVMSDAQEYMAATGEQVTDGAMRDMADRVAKKLKQQLQERADICSSRMAEAIHDQLQEGGWDKEFDDVISDIVDYPAAILKGPIVRKKKALSWSNGAVTVSENIAPEVERVDPFNFYPLPGVVNVDDGDVIEYHEYSAGDLHGLIGLPGYKEDAIRQAVRDYEGGYRDCQRGTLDSEKMRAHGESTGSMHESRDIGGIEFWGSVTGRELLEWGVSEDDVQDSEASYDVMAELVGRHVICVRFNPNPLGQKPYSRACFEDVTGSFWGKGVPELIEDCVNICNASARALVANMGIASGPQVAVNTASIPAGQSVTNIFPWKIWQLDYSKTGASSRPPIDFFQPNPMTDALLKVYDKFSQLADEYSGIPAYTYGSSENMGGAARTASGLSMLMNAASKSIKNVIRHVDSGVISPTINRFYVWNMLYNSDDSIKGDAQVVARGALSLVAREQNQMRLQELLQQTANPVDMKIIGMEGRAAMLRHAIQGVDVGADEIIPSKEELKDLMRTQAQAQQPQAVPNTGGQQQ